MCIQAEARSQREEQLAGDVQGLQAANTALQKALAEAQAKAGGPHLEAQVQRLAQELLLVRAAISSYNRTRMRGALADKPNTACKRVITQR